MKRWIVDNWPLVLMVILVVTGMVFGILSNDPETWAGFRFHTAIEIRSTPTVETVEAVDSHNCYEEGPLECPCAPELGEDD